MANWADEHEHKNVPGRDSDSSLWMQQPGEPDMWFARFDVYRTLGPRRTLAEAYRLIATAEGLRGKRPSKQWTRIAHAHGWRARAEAWDAAERLRLGKLEAGRRFDAREARLAMIERLLEAVFRVLVAAQMDEIGREEARALLPTLRMFFRDLIHAQRHEWQAAATEDGAPAAQAEATLRADDLLAAQAALERWQTRRKELNRHEA